MTKQPIADSRSTLEFLLTGAKRKGEAALIRTAFVQRTDPENGRKKPGPLATLVRRHDGTALDLYLLFRALTSAPPYDVARDARFWARALGLVDPEGNHQTATISRAWRRLQTMGLISRTRQGRTAKIVPRHESGRTTQDDAPDEEYQAPTGEDRDFYLAIPFAYWLDADRESGKTLHEELNLPEKAVLLIALSMLKRTFTITGENIATWYGISPESAYRGLKGLTKQKVLTTWSERRADASAPEGFAYDRHYRLNPPFDRRFKPTKTSDAADEPAGQRQGSA